MHAALDRNVGVGDGRSEQLAQRTQVKRIRRRHAPPLLQHVLELLKNGVLQNRVDDEHQRGHDTRKEARHALVLDDGDERANGRRGLGLCAAGERLVRFGLAPGRHARVDDPDGVGEEHRGAAGKGARNHRLDRREVLGRADSLDGGLFEARPGPLIPLLLVRIFHMAHLLSLSHVTHSSSRQSW